MKNHILFLFLLTIKTLTFSQEYTAIDTTDYLKRSLLIKEIDKKHEFLKKSFKKNYKKTLRNEILYSYQDLFDNLKRDVSDKKLVFAPEFTNYIDSITPLIVKNNATLIKNELNVYVTKHNSPNALSMGNGYVLLNMGLFKYLDNEAQLVSVLSHEIAHQILEHSEKGILNKAQLFTSEEKKQQIKEIKKKKYKKQSEALDIFKEILYSNSKKNRKEEMDADSLGFELYKNTKLPPLEFIKALEVLVRYDSLPSVVLKESIYKSIFNLPEQPFDEKWMQMESFTSYNYKKGTEKINQDSIKSHPELLERIDKLKNTFAESILTETTNTKENKKFKKIKRIAKFEDVANLFYNKKYGLSIYLTLFRLERNPESGYYKKWLGINFNKLYNAKKAYQFNKYVDKLIPDEQDESYQQFLNFLWNLRLNEIKTIADFYHVE